MFGSGRRPAKTRSELFRDELGETFDHLRQAATHGADSISTAMTPRVGAAKTAAMGTAAGAVARIAAARRTGMRQAGEAARKATPTMRRRKGESKREMARRRRGYRLAGLLAVGAAVGAVGALIGRRRRQVSWETYDEATIRPPQPPVEMAEAAPSGRPSTAPSPQPMPGQGTRGVGPLAEQARSALGSPTEPEAPEAEAIAPVTPARSRRSS